MSVSLEEIRRFAGRLPDAARREADRALEVTADRLDIPRDSRELGMSRLAVGILQSMTLTRFYLMVLKGAGYLRLRTGDVGGGLERLLKVAELDSSDRLGVAALIEVARNALASETAVEFEPAVVHVNRLHILQRFHDYLAEAGELPQEYEARYNTYTGLLSSAYSDFVNSDARSEKVFRVFHMREPREVVIPVEPLLVRAREA